MPQEKMMPWQMEMVKQFQSQFVEAVADRIAQKMTTKMVIALQWPPMLDYKDIMKFFDCQAAKAFDIMRLLPCKDGVGKKKVSIWGLLNWIDENPDLVKLNFPNYTGYGRDEEKAI